LPRQRPRAHRSPNRLASLVLTAPSPGPKPTVAVRAPRPSLSGRLHRREHDHGERRRLTVAGLLPATVAPPRRRNAAAELDFFSSPPMRSSGELAFHPPCPAGSLTVMGAQPLPFAPSPPLWRAPCCAVPSRAALAEAGPTTQVAPAWPWAELTPRAWAKRHCASEPSVVSAQRHSN
jgi:hypothetical protein